MLKKIGSALLALSLAVGLCLPVLGAENPEYPVVTKDFSDAAQLSQWTRLGNPNGTMTIDNGELKLGAADAFSEVAALYNQQKCKDFTAEFTYKFPEGDNNDAAMFVYRADALAAEGYAVYFVHCPNADKQYYIKFTSRPYQELKAGLFFNNDGKGVEYATDSVQVKMVVSGGVHTLYMTEPGTEYGEPIFTVTEEMPRYDRSGFLGFMQWHDGGERQVTTAFDDLKITCNDEGEAIVDPEPEDTSDVIGGTVTQDFSAPLSDKWGFFRKDIGGNNVEVVDDLLLLTTVGGNVPGESAAYYKDKFLNGTIEADVTLTLGNSTSIVFRGQDYMRNGYQLIFDRYAGLQLCKRPYEVLATAADFKVNLDVVYKTKITVDGNKITVTVSYEDDEGETQTVSLEYTDTANSFSEAGYVGFVNYAGMGVKTEAILDNLVITKVVPGTSTTEPTTGTTKGEEQTPDTGTAVPALAIAGVVAAAAGMLVSKQRK